jgi:hypothetical protein
MNMGAKIKSDDQLNTEYTTRIGLRNDVFYRIGTFNLDNLYKEKETPVKVKKARIKGIKYAHKGFCVQVKYKEHWLTVIRPYLKSKEIGDIGYIKSSEYTKGLYVGFYRGVFWKGTLSMANTKNLKVISLDKKKNYAKLKFNGIDLTPKELEKFFKTPTIKKIFGTNMHKGLEVIKRIVAKRNTL